MYLNVLCTSDDTLDVRRSNSRTDGARSPWPQNVQFCWAGLFRRARVSQSSKRSRGRFSASTVCTLSESACRCRSSVLIQHLRTVVWPRQPLQTLVRPCSYAKHSSERRPLMPRMHAQVTSDDLTLDMNHPDVMPVNYVPDRRNSSASGERPILIVKMGKGQVSRMRLRVEDPHECADAKCPCVMCTTTV